MRKAVTESARSADPAHRHTEIVFQSSQIVAVRVVAAGFRRVGEDLERTLVQRQALPRWLVGTADDDHRFQPQQAVLPAGRVVDLHSRRDPQDGDIQAVLQQRFQLSHAVHRVLEEFDVGAGDDIGIRDRSAGFQFEDVGHPYHVGSGWVLHVVGDRQQLPCFLEEALTPRGERDMPAIPHQERRAQLLFQLTDLLGQGRLADVQLRCGPAEVQFFGNRHKVADVTQIQVHVGFPVSNRPVGPGHCSAGAHPIHACAVIDPDESGLGHGAVRLVVSAMP